MYLLRCPFKIFGVILVQKCTNPYFKDINVLAILYRMHYRHMIIIKEISCDHLTSNVETSLSMKVKRALFRTLYN